MHVCLQSALPSIWQDPWALTSRVPLFVFTAASGCFVEQANLTDDQSAKTKALKEKEPERPVSFRDFPAVPPPPKEEPVDDGLDHDVGTAAAYKETGK